METTLIDLIIESIWATLWKNSHRPITHGHSIYKATADV